jgi:WS/DGAT/MGAT family acyltransferase
LRELYATVSNRVASATQGPQATRGNAPFGGPHTRLNQRVVAERSIGRFSLPLEDMRRIGRAYGGTVNDVLLAVADDGIQRYLREVGERPADPLVAMCPVSLREAGDFEAGTKAATLFVKLGSPRAGAGRRLGEIVASTARAKQEFHAMSKEAALDFAVIAFGLSLTSQAFGLDAYLRPVINFVVSNVGAVEGTRYLGQSRLTGAYPISMIADPTGLNFTSLSHDGRMDVGIVASRAAVPDAEVLMRHCLDAWRQLLRSRPPQDLTLRKPPARRRSRTRRMPVSHRA